MKKNTFQVGRVKILMKRKVSFYLRCKIKRAGGKNIDVRATRVTNNQRAKGKVRNSKVKGLRSGYHGGLQLLDMSRGDE